MELMELVVFGIGMFVIGGIVSYGQSEQLFDSKGMMLAVIITMLVILTLVVLLVALLKWSLFALPGATIMVCTAVILYLVYKILS